MTINYEAAARELGIYLTDSYGAQLDASVARRVVDAALEDTELYERLPLPEGADPNHVIDALVTSRVLRRVGPARCTLCGGTDVRDRGVVDISTFDDGGNQRFAPTVYGARVWQGDAP